METIISAAQIFSKGGPVMYVLLLCSLLVATIGIERFFFFFTHHTDVSLASDIAALLDNNDWQGALAYCRQNNRLGAQVAAKGIEACLRGGRYVESSLEGEAALAAAKLRANLNHLDTVVTLAPLLGLLGTVIGMIGSFSILNVKSGQPLAITGGVGEALIATAAGLCVATFALIVHSILIHRLEHLITDLEEICTVIISHVQRENSHEAS